MCYTRIWKDFLCVCVCVCVCVSDLVRGGDVTPQKVLSPLSDLTCAM